MIDKISSCKTIAIDAKAQWWYYYIAKCYVCCVSYVSLTTNVTCACIALNQWKRLCKYFLLKC